MPINLLTASTRCAMVSLQALLSATVFYKNRFSFIPLKIPNAFSFIPLKIPIAKFYILYERRLVTHKNHSYLQWLSG